MKIAATLAALLGTGILPGAFQEPQEQKPAKPKEKQEEAPPAEELHTVTKGNLTPRLELDSTFEPGEPAEIRLRLEAYQGDLTIKSIAAHGKAVRKGETILSIDTKPLERIIAAAENDLRVARAALAKARAEADLGARADALALSDAETALKNAEDGLKIFDEVDGKHYLKRIDLTVKNYEDYVSDQQEELDQLEKMYKSEELTNATAEIVVRRARRQLERLRIMLRMVRESASVAREIYFSQQRQTLVSSLEKARQALEAQKVANAQSAVQREAEAVKARAAVEQQEEQLAKLRRDLEKLTARAPLDGRVFYGQFQQGQWATTEQMVQQLRPGEKIQPHQILMTVCGPTASLVADLPESDYLDVHPDQAVTVAPAAFPDDRLQGRVRLKGFVPRPKGPAPSFEVNIALKDRKPDILPGMKAKVTVTGDELRDVVLVPSQAVSASGQKHTVTVSKDGKKSQREVTVGKSDGKMTHIKEGLEAGETIVLPKP